MDIYDRLYEALKYYVYNASPEELKEHYEWYNVEIGDEEDLINTMYESYYDSFDELELEERIKYLYE